VPSLRPGGAAYRRWPTLGLSILRNRETLSADDAAVLIDRLGIRADLKAFMDAYGFGQADEEKEKISVTSISAMILDEVNDDDNADELLPPQDPSDKRDQPPNSRARTPRCVNGLHPSMSATPRPRQEFSDVARGNDDVSPQRRRITQRPTTRSRVAEVDAPQPTMVSHYIAPTPPAPLGDQSQTRSSARLNPSRRGASGEPQSFDGRRGEMMEPRSLQPRRKQSGNGVRDASLGAHSQGN
jgi:hypothetical protein